MSSGRRSTVRRGRAPNGTGRRWVRWSWVGREGRTHSIPRDARGTFTPTYGVKVPFMRRRRGLRGSGDDAGAEGDRDHAGAVTGA